MLTEKASVVTAGWDTAYVLLAIVEGKLKKVGQPEHCKILSTHTLMSELPAPSKLPTPSKKLVAKPIRLPVKVIPPPAVQVEQLEVFVFEPSK